MLCLCVEESVRISCDAYYPPGHCSLRRPGMCFLSPFLGGLDGRTGSIIHLLARALQILHILTEGRRTLSDWWQLSVSAMQCSVQTWTLSPRLCWKLYRLITHQHFLPCDLYSGVKGKQNITNNNNKNLWEDPHSADRTTSRQRQDRTLAGG